MLLPWTGLCSPFQIGSLSNCSQEQEAACQAQLRPAHLADPTSVWEQKEVR